MHRMKEPSPPQAFQPAPSSWALVGTNAFLSRGFPIPSAIPHRRISKPSLAYRKPTLSSLSRNSPQPCYQGFTVQFYSVTPSCLHSKMHTPQVAPGLTPSAILQNTVAQARFHDMNDTDPCDQAKTPRDCENMVEL